jgi:multiple sugar transport system ATP-binding protein
MTTGDRVAVLRDGVLQQCAAPHELYRDPANVFVGGFMGSPAMNIFTVPVINQTVSLGDWMIPIPREIADAATEVVVGIRPEHFDIDGLGVEIEVEVVEELGSDAFIYGRLVAGADNTTTADKPIVARADWRRPPERGTRIHLRPSPGHILFFANDPTGRRLR